MIDTAAPKVSVLVPCYNAAPYIADALDSILVQTWPNIEIIVVDDGSTDGSAAIVEGYARRAVELIRQERQGAAAARNLALAVSTAEFILFLDADDLIARDHISALLSAIANAPLCVAMSQWDRFYSSPTDALFPHRPGYRDAAGVDWLVEELITARPMMQSGMFLVPRTLLSKVGGWDERLSLIDDFEFFTRVIASSAGLRFASSARLYYRSGMVGSLSGSKRRSAVESAFLSVTLATQHLLDAENSPRTRRACANILQEFDYLYYPEHADLRTKTRARVAELGGADLAPDGPPGFQKLRRAIGWRAARRVQRLAERLRLTSTSRARLMP